MATDNKSQGIDLGVAVGLCTLLIGAAYFCGNTLKDIPGNDEGAALNGLLWTVATGFFAALSLTSFLALLGKAVTTVSEQPNETWTIFSSVMLRFSLYVLIHWFILWGIPFIAAMSIFLLVKPVYGTVLASILCIIAIFVSSILTVKVLPSMAVPQYGQVKLVSSLGEFRAVVIIIGCFIVAEIFINRCYTFNVEGVNSLYQKADTLEIKVALKGVVNNKDKLAAEIYQVNAGKTPIVSFDFIKYDEGKYVTWRDLDKLEAGIYRLEVFFRNYSGASLLKKIQLQMGNNHRRERFAFKLVEGKKN